MDSSSSSSEDEAKFEIEESKVEPPCIAEQRHKAWKRLKNFQGIAEDMELFTQVNFLWLFDPFMKFSEREMFIVEDSSLSVTDIDDMRTVNRILLTSYLHIMEEEGSILNDSTYERSVGLLVNLPRQEKKHVLQQKQKECWADEFIEEQIQVLLKVEENGKFLMPDITAHIEYFYNTLNFAFQASNPFTHTGDFPALSYKKPSQSSESYSDLKLLSPDKLALPMLKLQSQDSSFEMKQGSSREG
jgi:hypothetical protein